MKVLLVSILFTLCSNILMAASIEASFETDPIDLGYTESDDAAFYFNEEKPDESEILAVSKCDEKEACGGFYVYNLKGKQKQSLKVGELNNIDKSTINGNHYAFATNREEIGVSVFKRDSNIWKHLGVLTLADKNGLSYEPYGLCSDKDKLAITTKSGMVYIYNYNGSSLKLADTISLKNAALSYDDFILEVTRKTTKKKNKLHKLEKYIRNRFVSEGCVFDDQNGDLYLSQEKLGVWRFDGRSLQLVKKIQGSFADINNTNFTDDVEGISIYRKNGRSYLAVSSQGLNKILFLDMNNFETVASHDFYFGKLDPVTATDGVLTVSQSTKQFPEGFMVIHDDENTTNTGELIYANYKIIDMRNVKL